MNISFINNFLISQPILIKFSLKLFGCLFRYIYFLFALCFIRTLCAGLPGILGQIDRTSS